MTCERGSITLWMVGLVMVVFAVGGIAIDLWRGLAVHRQVAAVADAAAVAAGSAVDEEAWRTDGALRLDPARVAERVEEAVAAQPAGVVDGYSVETAADGSAATISVSATVDLTLLGLLVDDRLAIGAEATASPVISP